MVSLEKSWKLFFIYKQLHFLYLRAARFTTIHSSKIFRGNRFFKGKLRHSDGDKDSTLHTVDSVSEKPVFNKHSQRNTLYSIQVFRGVAAVLVVLYHATQFVQAYYQHPPLGGFFLFGFAGVHLFFVLSGFIIFTIHCNDIGKPRKLMRYIKKRLIRIYPIYWFTLAIMAAWYLFAKTITSADILQNIFLLKMPTHWINPVCWTLSFEILFYFIFAFLILNRIIGWAIILSWVAVVAYTNIAGVHLSLFFIHYAFHKYTVLFMIGMFFAYLNICLGRLEVTAKNRAAYAALICGPVIFAITAFFVLLHKIVNWDTWPITLGFGLSSGIFMLCCLSESIESFFQKQRVLTFIGDASFSIYLLHYFLVSLLIPYSKGLFPSISQYSVTLLFALICTLTVLAGCLLYQVVERPMLNFLRKTLLGSNR